MKTNENKSPCPLDKGDKTGMKLFERNIAGFSIEQLTYQEMLAENTYAIVNQLKIAYLAIEMRVGKTIIALRAAELLGAKSVLFVTKKKAIGSIESDYAKMGFGYYLKVTNYEQLHNITKGFDVLIADEAHGLGAFPKPSQRAKELKRIIALSNSKLILLSGTPSPESYSQLFHQFWVSRSNPFNLESFYKWAHEYVKITEKIINGFRVRDYSNANREMIMKVLDKYFIRYTQKEAGFSQNEVTDEIIVIPENPNVAKMVKILMKDKYYKFNDGSEVIADTAAKLQSKIHQACSGTILTEQSEGKTTYKIIDISKAKYIREHYAGQKIAIFYKFVAEGDVLKKTIHNWTDSPEIFNSQPETTFICQIVSGSMGTNLSSAEVLIFYNIDFSSLQYWQARARLQTFDRDRIPHCHWLFSENGIEHKVYKAVLNKKDYTTYYFKKDFGYAG